MDIMKAYEQVAVSPFRRSDCWNDKVRTYSVKHRGRMLGQVIRNLPSRMWIAKIFMACGGTVVLSRSTRKSAIEVIIEAHKKRFTE